MIRLMRLASWEDLVANTRGASGEDVFVANIYRASERASGSPFMRIGTIGGYSGRSQYLDHAVQSIATF